MPGFDGFLAQGVPFCGVFSSAAASTASMTTEPLHRFSLFVAGATAATTINSNDQVIITDVQGRCATATATQIYDGADNDVGSGELIFAFNSAAVITTSFVTPHWCQVGSYPKLKTAGDFQVDVNIHGVIKRSV